MGKKLTGISVHHPNPSTQIYLKDKEYLPFGTGGGYLRPAITVSEFMNFTYKLIPEAAGGKKLKNGTWTGHVGNLLYGRAELAAITVSALNRLPYIDMCSPTEFSRITFCHGNPNPILSWKSIFWPFTALTWILFLNTGAATVVTLKILTKFAAKANDTKAWSTSFTIWVILSSMLQQNVSKIQRWDIRCLLTSWFLFLVLLTQAFLSNLFGFFVSPPLEFVPNTFQELATSDFLAGITYKGAIYQFFSNAKKGTTVDKVFQKFRTTEIQDCYANVLKGDKYICVSLDADITFTRLVKYGDRQGRSNLVLTTGPTFDLPGSISVKKRSILYSRVSRVTSACFENGLTLFWRERTIEEQRRERFKKEKKNHLEMRPVGNGRSEDAHPLSGVHLTGAFSLYLAGLFGSIFAMTFELPLFFMITVVSSSAALANIYIYQKMKDIPACYKAYNKFFKHFKSAELSSPSSKATYRFENALLRMGAQGMIPTLVWIGAGYSFLAVMNPNLEDRLYVVLPEDLRGWKSFLILTLLDAFIYVGHVFTLNFVLLLAITYSLLISRAVKSLKIKCTWAGVVFKGKSPLLKQAQILENLKWYKEIQIMNGMVQDVFASRLFAIAFACCIACHSSAIYVAVAFHGVSKFVAAICASWAFLFYPLLEIVVLGKMGSVFKCSNGLLNTWRRQFPASQSSKFSILPIGIKLGVKITKRKSLSCVLLVCKIAKQLLIAV
ncbi:unnamed protein product [Allacma fusca]|uniref:Ionotropic glutamate receptor C-terminal domain-containing protein n=1 Tax=Allacma fusca TaxID=39272 RepID=A0A8J2L649_9HEXA|nr:unnamed protein product [Allacma fusca]